MVKGRRIPEYRTARIRIVRVPCEKELVGSVESEFRSGTHAREGSEQVLQRSEFRAFRPKTHRPGRKVSAGRRSLAQISPFGSVEAEGIRERIPGRSRRTRYEGLHGVHERSGRRRFCQIADESERSSRRGGESGGVPGYVGGTVGKDCGTLKIRACACRAVRRGFDNVHGTD